MLQGLARYGLLSLMIPSNTIYVAACTRAQLDCLCEMYFIFERAVLLVANTTVIGPYLQTLSL
jgi:hypothetical protein